MSRDSVHVRDFPQENQGPEHNPGLEAAELTGSWYAGERRDFLSWMARAAPPLARAARLALAAKGVTESFTQTFAPAATAPSNASMPRRRCATPWQPLANGFEQLREDENDSLELGSEEVVIEGKVFQRFAARGSAWAASLAAAMRSAPVRPGGCAAGAGRARPARGIPGRAREPSPPC